MNSLVTLRFLLATLLFGFSLGPVWALDPPIVQDAYGLGMGGADCAIGEDTHAVEVNPAGLAMAVVPMAQIGLGMPSSPNAFDLNAVVLYPLQDGTVFALSQFSSFDTGYTDTSVVGSAAMPLDSSRDLFMGLNLKYMILSNPANPVEGVGRGFGLDCGFTYHVRDAQGEAACFGLSVKDLTSDIRFANTGEESITRTFNFGAAYEAIQNTRIELDADLADQTLGPTHLADQLNLGAEHFFQNRTFSVRAGYQDLLGPQGVLTLGGGYQPTQPFEIAYAFEISADFKQVSNFLTFVYRLDDWHKNKTESTNAEGEITLEQSAVAEAAPVTFSDQPKPISGVPVRKIKMKVEPELISGSGESKTTSISFPDAKSKDTASWELLILDSKGKALRRIDGTGSPISALTWDGTDDAGQLLPPAVYQINLRTFNTENRILSDDFAKVQIVPARSRFAMTVSAPYLSLARSSTRKELVFTPQTDGSYNVPSWKFEVTDVQTGKIVYERKGRLKIPSSIKWNGRTAKWAVAADGTYDCVLSAVDKLGNSLTTDPVEVTIRSAPPVISLTGDGHWIDFSKSTQMKFNLTVADSVEIQDWSVKLLDEKGNVLKIFLEQEAPPSQIVWNGKTDLDEMVAPGTFVRADFSVQDKAGNTAKTPIFPVQVEAQGPTGAASLSMNLATVYFPVGGGNLDEAAKKELHKSVLSIKPYLAKSFFIIKGYTASGESPDEVSLSHARAESVREYLTKTFSVPEDQIDALGYADQEILQDASGPAAADKQRRATITIFTKP
ncbi:MAG: OmpA family protein [bacterium]